MAALVLPAGCSRESPAPAASPMAGAARDANGCVDSAGYVWCEREQACVRPWELAQQRGFHNSEADFRDFCSHGVIGHAEDRTEQVLGTARLHGKLAGFRWGDYLHAEIRDAQGMTHNLFVGSEDACFLARHAGQPLEIEYNRVSRYFEEAGGFHPAEVITQIRAGRSDYRSWRAGGGAADASACERAIERRVLKSPE